MRHTLIQHNAIQETQGRRAYRGAERVQPQFSPVQNPHRTRQPQSQVFQNSQVPLSQQAAEAFASFQPNLRNLQF